MGDGRDLLVKGPRMALCRFHSIHAVHEHMHGIRNKRLVMWLYLGLNLGFIKTLQSCCMVERLEVDGKAGTDTTKGAMKTQPAESIAKERGDAKHTLHLATRILLNATWMRKDDVFYCVTKPVQAAQGAQARDNKGETGALQYSLAMARGEGVRVLLDIVAKFDNAESCSYMGFKLGFAEVAAHGMLTEELKFFIMREECEWLQLVVGLVFSIVGARALSMQSDWSAFPGKAVLLLSKDREEVSGALAYLKSLHDVIGRRSAPGRSLQ